MKKLLNCILAIISLQPLTVGAQGLSTFADLLIWSASEETASPWATVITEPTDLSIVYTAPNIYFNTKPGFRGGFIYDGEPVSWDTKLYWTYFATNAKSEFPTSLTQLITPGSFSGFLSKDFFFGASSKWQLFLNMIDAEIGHQFNVGDTFSVRPSIGIKGGWINQTIHSKYDAYIYTSTDKIRNNFSGLGPSFGLETEWNIINNLDLIANFQTAFLWGSWDVEDIYSRPEAFFGLVTPTTIKTTLNNSLGTIMFDYFLGLEWAHKGKSQVTIRLGYEMQYWENQLRLTDFEQLPAHGDLILQGGTCRILIDL
jgi:hypothetical protein